MFQKSVFLLNFLYQDECQAFLDTFHNLKRKVFSYLYEDDYEDPCEFIDHHYEDVEPVNQEHVKNREKNERKDRKYFFWLNKGKKQKKMNETKNAKKLSISSPNPESFEHKCHAGFEQSGFVIEGMDISIFQNLIREAGISNDLVSNDNYVSVKNNKKLLLLYFV